MRERKLTCALILVQVMFLQFSAENIFGGEMESFTLRNNIKVVFAKTDGPEVVSLRVLTPVAVVNETANNAGISYLTLKLMTRSTKNRSGEKLINDIENIGAYLSGDADYDMSEIAVFFLPSYFDEAAEILADVVSNPVFDERELNFEKKNVIASLASSKDDIRTVSFDEFSKLFYGSVSYASPVLGTEQTVLKISKDDLIKWHKYSYNSSNILISVVGNIDRNIVKKSLEKHFSPISSGIKFKKTVINVKHDKALIKEIKGKFNQAFIQVGFPAPKILDKDFVALKVANAVLGGRMTSRLFIELREKLGLAYEVNAVYPSRIEQSYFTVYIGLDKKNIASTLKRIDEILKDFCATKVSDQELKDTKTYIKGQYVMDRQTVNRQSYCYGWREIVGQGYEYDNIYLNEVDKITSQDILNVANRIFSQKSITLIINSQR